MAKPKVALYWAASCGGCEICVIDIEEKILDVAAAFDIVLWPCVMDFKYKDVEAMEDGSILVTLFNGAVRTSEQEYLAHLLRRKSKIMVAFGSCAHEGCLPALANVSNKREIFQIAYHDTPSTDNPDGVEPQTKTTVPEGELELPEFYDTVKTLDQVVDVDYYVPGCPPQSDKVWEVFDHLIQGKPLPEKGAILGAGTKTCCDECPRERKEKKIKKFYRPHEIIADPNECLLDQGILCMGPATRDGCGAKCVTVGIPCRGCYGPPPGDKDQGMKMISALSSVIDSEDPEEIDQIISQIADPLGTFYRFGLAHSTLRRVQGDVAQR
ncbi:MAG: oxidoreductase [Acidithiobacillales bacterium SM23_46]|nr:MAG: oxidoreductase [Acidithiobacillales bacterium SM23_46]